MWKSWTSLVGSERTRKKASTSVSWKNWDCFRFSRWPNFPQKLFRQSLANARIPGFFSIFSPSRDTPSFSKYRRIYSLASSGVLIQSGGPLASCLYFRNVLIYEANSPPSFVSASYWVVSFQWYTSYILRTRYPSRTAVWSSGVHQVPVMVRSSSEHPQRDGLSFSAQVLHNGNFNFPFDL